MLDALDEAIGSDLNIIYSKKQKGYVALNEGDYLQAYYIFLELKKTIIGTDPDVDIKFLHEDLHMDK